LDTTRHLATFAFTRRVYLFLVLVPVHVHVLVLAGCNASWRSLDPDNMRRFRRTRGTPEVRP
jgi:hypothetical protein